MKRSVLYCLPIILVIAFSLQARAADDIQKSEYTYIEDEAEMMPLTLDDVLKIAVINNFDIQIARYDRAISDADIDDALSIYDTVMEMTAEYTHSELEKTSTLVGRVSEDYETNVNLSKRFRYGTDVDVDYNFSRHRTDSAFAQINPSEQSYVQFTFTQPLLKNIFGINDRGDVRITKIDVDNYRSETLDTIEEELADVEKAYWELLLKIYLIEIRGKMYKRAEDFLKITTDKEEIGSAELTDLYAAKANKKLRGSELIVEKANLKAAQNTLKLLVNNKEAAASVDISPAEEIVISDDDVRLVPSLKTAFENRRDYKRARREIESKDIDLLMKKNEMWPQLDLEGSFRMNGIKRSFWGSVEDMTEETNTEYYAGVTFSIPLERREERSALTKAQNEKAKALLDLKKTEKTILSEIDSDVRKVNAYRQKAKEYSGIAELQKLKLEEEEKKYRYGRSDSDRIIRFQEDYLNAEIARVAAILDYQEALIGLYLYQNTYLEERDLTAQ